MHDKLLFYNVKTVRVPIDVIQKCVSQASNKDIELLTMSNKIPGARKHETATAREISMLGDE